MKTISFFGIEAGGRFIDNDEFAADRSAPARFPGAAACHPKTRPLSAGAASARFTLSNKASTRPRALSYRGRLLVSQSNEAFAQAVSVG
jgi:hypothetical protein